MSVDWPHLSYGIANDGVIRLSAHAIPVSGEPGIELVVEQGSVERRPWFEVPIGGCGPVNSEDADDVEATLRIEFTDGI